MSIEYAIQRARTFFLQWHKECPLTNAQIYYIIIDSGYPGDGTEEQAYYNEMCYTLGIEPNELAFAANRNRRN